MSQRNSLALLNLLQVADSAFPVGAYAMSRGWETLLADAVITTPVDVVTALETLLLVSLACSDLVAVREAHRLAARADCRGLHDLDTLVTALASVQEWRDTSGKMGRRMLTLGTSLLSPAVPPVLSTYHEAVSLGQLHGSQSVAWGVVTQALAIDEEASLYAYAQGSVQAHVSVAARLIPLGQSVAVTLVHQLKPTVVAAVARSLPLTLDEMSGSLPRAEIAGMAHRFAPARLFVS